LYEKGKFKNIGLWCHKNPYILFWKNNINNIVVLTTLKFKENNLNQIAFLPIKSNDVFSTPPILLLLISVFFFLAYTQIPFSKKNLAGILP